MSLFWYREAQRRVINRQIAHQRRQAQVDLLDVHWWWNLVEWQVVRADDLNPIRRVSNFGTSAVD